jgi:hypothetical protein
MKAMFQVVHSFGVAGVENGSHISSTGHAAPLRFAVTVLMVRAVPPFVVTMLGMPSTPVEAGDLTRLLKRWSDGERAALDELMPLVYERLRHIAHDRLRNEPSGLSLNTTAIVHDAGRLSRHR